MKVEVNNSNLNLVEMRKLYPGDFFYCGGELFLVISGCARNSIPFDYKVFSLTNELFRGFDNEDLVLPIDSERLTIKIS